MNGRETNRDMIKKCPQCGAALPASALGELCPACLLEQGAVSDTGAQSEPTRFQPPGLDEVARLFPQLEILAFIGKGGMGAVYKARQPALDRFVALKILPSQAAGGPGFAERFNREARALARLSHPNIVAVHEFGKVEQASSLSSSEASKTETGNMPVPLHFFIMEYVDGLNLRQLERVGKLSPREALQIVPQICEALQFAHDEGVVHRDIKPENILLDKKGRVKIADFGIAKIMGREPGVAITETKGAIGTPHYMAPEQVEKPQTVDHRADIFSLGVVFYEMLTGELPLGKFAPPSRKVQVDVRLDEIVLRALEKEPELRYQQASQVKTDVETIRAGAAAERIVRAESTASKRYAVLSLVLFLAGTLGTLLLMTISWRHDLALVFGTVGLVFALIFGILGRHERLGKTMAIAVSGVFVVVGGTVAVLTEMIPLGTKAREARTAALRAERLKELNNAAAAATIRTVDSLPPVVVQTQPSSGARDVAPGIVEIRVKFSKEMTDGSWSWTSAWPDSTPEAVGRPSYDEDRQTCLLKVKLEPGRTYAWWLNSEKFQNFKEKHGNPALPYLLIFRTSSPEGSP